ncbi:SapB/AmfS family lanthipeptide [Nocardiopsis sp. MG754419]|nr:SapB/AmfS family lanthipeptide [Nocardiopsis sp. MG754419]MBR8743259.1 hypothetical protein [Nocardiopsis sp. MG754419]
MHMTVLDLQNLEAPEGEAEAMLSGISSDC